MGVKMEKCTTIPELINGLGGDAVLAKELGITYAAVGMWKVRGNIASGFHLRLLAMAKRRGLDVAPEVFGYRAEDVAELFHNAPVSVNTRLHAVA